MCPTQRLGHDLIDDTKPRKSSLVSVKRAAASSALPASPQRIAAQPSGEATE